MLSFELLIVWAHCSFLVSIPLGFTLSRWTWKNFVSQIAQVITKNEAALFFGSGITLSLPVEEAMTCMRFRHNFWFSFSPMWFLCAWNLFSGNYLLQGAIIQIIVLTITFALVFLCIATGYAAYKAHRAVLDIHTNPGTERSSLICIGPDDVRLATIMAPPKP